MNAIRAASTAIDWRARTGTAVLHAARILVGAFYLFAGLNYFFELVALGNSHEFLELMIPGGYFAFVKALQVAGGIMLLSNRFVVAGLVLLTPVTVNIVIFLITIYQAQIADGVVVLILNLVLLWGYRDAFREIFRPQRTPKF
ncbi:MAG: DoxX family protein [Gammaproteobacteria bacterium]|nr:DoxX family protein [Gammaproteobacteria bacterium]